MVQTRKRAFIESKENGPSPKSRKCKQIRSSRLPERGYKGTVSKKTSTSCGGSRVTRQKSVTSVGTSKRRALCIVKDVNNSSPVQTSALRKTRKSSSTSPVLKSRCHSAVKDEGNISIPAVSKHPQRCRKTVTKYTVEEESDGSDDRSEEEWKEVNKSKGRALIKRNQQKKIKLRTTKRPCNSSENKFWKKRKDVYQNNYTLKNDKNATDFVPFWLNQQKFVKDGDLSLSESSESEQEGTTCKRNQNGCAFTEKEPLKTSTKESCNLDLSGEHNIKTVGKDPEQNEKPDIAIQANQNSSPTAVICKPCIVVLSKNNACITSGNLTGNGRGAAISKTVTASDTKNNHPKLEDLELSKESETFRTRRNAAENCMNYGRFANCITRKERRKIPETEASNQLSQEKKKTWNFRSSQKNSNARKRIISKNEVVDNAEFLNESESTKPNNMIKIDNRESGNVTTCIKQEVVELSENCEGNSLQDNKQLSVESPRPKRMKASGKFNTKRSSNSKMDCHASISSDSESEWEEVKDDSSDNSGLDDYHPEIPEGGISVMVRRPKEKKYKPRKVSHDGVNDIHPQNSNLDDYHPEIPKGGIYIMMKRKKENRPRKKTLYDRMERIRLKINRQRKEVQVTIHQVHLLCLIAHSLHLNKTLNTEEVMAFGLSLVPPEITELVKKSSRVDAGIMKKLLRWFHKTVSVDEQYTSDSISTRKLCSALGQKHASNVEQFNFLFLVISRALGLQSRLCHSLHPISFKGADLLKKPKRSDYNKFTLLSKLVERKRMIATQKENRSVPQHSSGTELKGVRNANKHVRASLDPGCHSDETVQTQCHALPVRKQPRRSAAKRSYKFSSGESDIDDSDNDKDFCIKKCEDSDITLNTTIKRKFVNQKQLRNGLGRLGGGTEATLKQTKETLRKDVRCAEEAKNLNRKSKKNTTVKRNPRRSVTKKVYTFSSDEGEADDEDKDKDFRVEDADEESSDDDDLEAVQTDDEDFSENEDNIPDLKKEKPNIKISKGAAEVNQNKSKTLASKKRVSCSKKKVVKKGIDCWVEVYSSLQQRWICIECFNGIVDEPYEIEKVATRPISYVIAVDNSSCVKDVTKRYCAEWLTQGRKQQACSEWWEETLRPFRPRNAKADRQEDAQIESILRAKPLPSKLNEFRDHPFFALKSQIGIVEALYPSDAPPLGFFNGDPIYARECIHKLRTRLSWYKEARLVRAGEKPYKLLKGPKWDRASRTVRYDHLYEFFGKWQTDPYVPHIASSGKIPRNEYGNVELFKPCMLPAGTVHLRLPGLNRIANKLGIDCCPAVVGFKGHKSTPHAIYDGFVVCKEHENMVVEAWQKEQEKIQQRQTERREKRIYGNWKKLIRGLLIREKIKMKYGV